MLKRQEASDPRGLIDEIYDPQHDVTPFAKQRFPHPLKNPLPGRRALSAGLFGLDEGDSGKGTGLDRINRELLEISDGQLFPHPSLSGKSLELLSERTGGGGNMGHEKQFRDGRKYTAQQLAVAAMLEQAGVILSRNMRIHPEDLNNEILHVEKLFGHRPNIMVDINVPLATDTERAFEKLLDLRKPMDRLSVGRGMSPSSAWRLMKIGPTMRDLMDDDNWQQRFTGHYEFVRSLMTGLGYSLEEIEVVTYGLPAKNRPVGSLNEYLGNLAKARANIKPFVRDNVFEIVANVWSNPAIPVTFEGAQAFGLSPDFGIDFTSTEPGPRGILTATEGTILPEKVGAIFGLIKTPWMTSSGRRIFPGGPIPEDEAQKIRDEFNEYGRTDPVPRDIYPGQVPLYQMACRVDQPTHLYFTHLDATLKNVYVAVVYYDKSDESKSPRPYRPYQWYLNQLKAEIVPLPGWNGGQANKARNPLDLPENALRLLEFYCQAMGVPPGYASVGPYEDEVVTWLE